jgi:hypothetical protein
MVIWPCLQQETCLPVLGARVGCFLGVKSREVGCVFEASMHKISPGLNECPLFQGQESLLLGRSSHQPLYNNTWTKPGRVYHLGKKLEGWVLAKIWWQSSHKGQDYLWFICIVLQRLSLYDGRESYILYPGCNYPNQKVSHLDWAP